MPGRRTGYDAEWNEDFPLRGGRNQRQLAMDIVW
jgi:hypothetical protein